MKSIQNVAATCFVITVSILTTVSVLGVWDVFGRDVISKSFQTIGLLSFVAVVVMVAGKFMEKRSEILPGATPELPSPTWKSIRSITVTILIAAVSLLALVGVLAIWDVIADRNVLNKSLSSLGILAFGAFIIVMTCLHMEGKFNKDHKGLSGVSIGGILLLLFLFWVFSGFFRMF